MHLKLTALLALLHFFFNAKPLRKSCVVVSPLKISHLTAWVVSQGRCSVSEKKESLCSERAVGTEGRSKNNSAPRSAQSLHSCLRAWSVPYNSLSYYVHARQKLKSWILTSFLTCLLFNTTSLGLSALTQPSQTFQNP